MIKLIDIAREVDLNVSVVSRALHPGPDRHPVKKETRDKIIAAAERLGYRPNRQAAFLKKGSSATIFCFLPDFACRLLGDLVFGISEAACEENFPVNFYFGKTQEDFHDFFRLLSRVSHSAVLTYPPPHQPEYPAAATLHELPPLPDNCRTKLIDYHRNGGNLLLLNSASNIAECDDPEFRKIVKIDIDDYRGGQLVAEHLLAKGCRQFYHCRSTCYYNHRYSGFADVLQRAGFRPRELTFERLAELASISERVGIFAASDLLAYDILGAMRELRIETGKTLLLTGFDDEFPSAFFRPSLTTVRQPTREEGRCALKKLIRMMNGDSESDELIAPELILRESTGDVPAQDFCRPHLQRS